MYALINGHVNQLLGQIDRARHVEPYEQLLEAFDAGPDFDNDDFRGAYQAYWQLNPARLTGTYRDAYFSLLQTWPRGEAPNIRSIAERLFETPCDGAGNKKLQFSFATKLAHMIDRTTPIYDSTVARFYYLPERTRVDREVRLADRLASHQFLVEEYARILREGLLAPTIHAFRERFEVEEIYTDQKIIDTLIWRFVSWSGGGAVRSRDVWYS